MTDDLFGYSKPMLDEKEARQTWQTPRRLAAELVREFDLDLDLAADWNNAVCPEFWTKKHDALSRPWPSSRRKWCNPPFAKAKDFAKAAELDKSDGGVTLFLCLDRGTQWLEQAKMGNRWWNFAGRVDYSPPGGIEGSGVTFGSVLLLFDRSAPVGFAGWRHPEVGVEIHPPFPGLSDLLAQVEAELAPGARERLADPSILDDDVAPFESGVVDSVSRLAELLGLGWS